MHINLTEIGNSDSSEVAKSENEAPVTPGHSEEATLIGASDAGPRVERAEARQQRDDLVAVAQSPSVKATDITDYKAFVTFLHAAGFSRAFAKRVTNRDAFKVAAEPNPDDQQIAQAIRTKFAEIGLALKG